MLTELSPNESLTAVMSGAASSTNPHCFTFWTEDPAAIGNDTAQALNGTTAVTLLAAPSSKQRCVKRIILYNADNASVTVTISKVIDGTSYTITKVTIAAGSMTTITATGVVSLDSSGQALQSSPASFVNIDAGSSGTAGTVDVFPATAAKGKLSLTAADSAGDTTTTIVNASQAAARTYTIPDAGANAVFVTSPEGVSAVTATVGGGTTGLIPAAATHVTITSDDATKQVSLPAAKVGKKMSVFVGANGCEMISAVAADEINGVVVGATNELALAANTHYELLYVATDKWIVRGFDDAGADLAALVPDAL